MTTRFQPRVAPRPLDAIVRHLKSLAPLTEDEVSMVRALSERRERYAPGEQLQAEGEPLRRTRFIVSGWAARQRVIADGRRQIFGFLLPGDAVQGCERLGEAAMTSTVALTSLEVVDADPLMAVMANGGAAGIRLALEKSRNVVKAQLLDHVVRLGRQTAYERVANFLLELQHRLEVAGHGDGQRFPLPLTQEILADALGLSIVHVNRTLQQLRRERLIELRSGVAILLQPELLASLGEYRQGQPARRKLAPA